MVIFFTLITNSPCVLPGSTKVQTSTSIRCSTNVTVSAHPHSRHHFDTTSFGVVPTDVVMTAGQTQRFMNQNGTCVTGEQTTPIFLCTADTTAIRINGRFVAVNVYCTVFLRTNATVSIFTHCAMYHGSNGTFGSHSSDSTPNTTPNPNHTPKKPQHTKTQQYQSHAAVQHNTAAIGSLTFRTHTGARIVQHVAISSAPSRIQIRIYAHDFVVAEIATQKIHGQTTRVPNARPNRTRHRQIHALKRQQ